MTTTALWAVTAGTLALVLVPAQAVPALLAATDSPFTAQRAWTLLAEVYDELGSPDAAAQARQQAADLLAPG